MRRWSGVLWSVCSISLAACCSGADDAASGVTSKSGATSVGATDASSSSGVDSETSGDGVLPSCLPEELRGAWLASVDGMNLYEGLGYADYLIERPGAELLTKDQVAAVRQSLDGADFLDIDGVICFGRGGCGEGYEHHCLVVCLSTHTTSIEALPGQIAPLLSGVGEGCFGIAVELIGLTEPRCSADDPECGPANTCYDKDYEPGAPRLPEPAWSSEGACSHDGDCWLNGSGDSCDAWTVPGFFGFGSGVWPDCGLCGCIDGLCQWFKQD